MREIGDHHVAYNLIHQFDFLKYKYCRSYMCAGFGNRASQLAAIAREFFNQELTMPVTELHPRDASQSLFG